jgi:hypothetical protein
MEICTNAKTSRGQSIILFLLLLVGLLDCTTGQDLTAYLKANLL